MEELVRTYKALADKKWPGDLEINQLSRIVAHTLLEHGLQAPAGRAVQEPVLLTRVGKVLAQPCYASRLGVSTVVQKGWLVKVVAKLPQSSFVRDKQQHTLLLRLESLSDDHSSAVAPMAPLPAVNSSLLSKDEHIARYELLISQKWPGADMEQQLCRNVAQILLHSGFRITPGGAPRSNLVLLEIVGGRMGSQHPEVWKALGGKAATVLTAERLPASSFRRTTGGSNVRLSLVFDSLSGSEGHIQSIVAPAAAALPVPQAILTASLSRLPSALNPTTASGSNAAGWAAPAMPSALDPAPAKVVSTVSSPAEAIATLAHLRLHTVLAVHCEMDGTCREARLCVVQVQAGLCCFIFQLTGADTEPLKALLAGLFGDSSKKLVMHDCRRVAEALFYELNVRPANVLDTQVMYALLAHCQALAGETAPDSSTAQRRISLTDLLTALKFPGGQDHAVAARDVKLRPGLWAEHPLPIRLQQYAASKVSSLLDVHECLEGRLQRAQRAACSALSNAHALSLLDPPDCPGQQNEAYKAAVKLPINVDLEVTFASQPDGRLAMEYSPFLQYNDLHPDDAASTGSQGASAEAAYAADTAADATAAEADTLHSIFMCLATDVRPHVLACLDPAIRLQLTRLLRETCTAAPDCVTAFRSSAVSHETDTWEAELANGAADPAANEDAEPHGSMPGRVLNAVRQALTRRNSGSSELAPVVTWPALPASHSIIHSAPNSSTASSDLAISGPLTAPAGGSQVSAQAGQYNDSHQPSTSAPSSLDAAERQSASDAGQNEDSALSAGRKLVEIVADSGRPVTVHFSDRSREKLPVVMDVDAAVELLTERAGQFAGKLGRGGVQLDWADPFRTDGRLGLPGTLHRISAIRGHAQVTGLTYRVGRHVPGVGQLLLDLLANLHVDRREVADGDVLSPSLLLLGPPGVGKTTLLRDVTNLLADRFQRRVVVVDTSDEIGGAGEKPHPCIADARRIPVREGRQQYEVLLEATKNHTPEVLVVDEIGSAQEAAALKGIAQRGVIMVATAHGVSLQGLLKNPDLNSLVGGVGPVILGDAEARASNRGVKTRLERKGAPVFCTLVEVTGYGELRVHTNVAASVDALLANRAPAVQHRRLMPDGRMVVRFETAAPGGHAECGDAKGPAGSLGLAPWLQELLPLVQ